MCRVHKESTTVHEIIECYNVTEEDQEEEYPRKVQLPETEGECTVEGPKLESNAYVKTLRVFKVNIGTKDKPNFVNIGDYWNNEIVENFVYFLRLPTTFLEMKGIVGELGEINISLNPYAKTVIWRPYWLNMKHKEKVKEEIDRMLEVGIIEPIVESNLISLMVVQDNKTWGIRICVDLIKLNDACLHDPFSTPFTDEVLYNVGGKDAYSFIDGFSGYHQIKIAPQERHKITFVTE
jgi:hypothetical protein